MQDKALELYVKATNSLDHYFRGERGQGAVEYVGIVLAVAVLIAAVILVFGANQDLGNALIAKITEAINQLHP